MTERPEIAPMGRLASPGADAENEIHGTISALVGAPRPVSKNLEETRAAIANG